MHEVHQAPTRLDSERISFWDICWLEIQPDIHLMDGMDQGALLLMKNMHNLFNLSTAS